MRTRDVWKAEETRSTGGLCGGDPEDGGQEEEDTLLPATRHTALVCHGHKLSYLKNKQLGREGTTLSPGREQ